MFWRLTLRMVKSQKQTVNCMLCLAQWKRMLQLQYPHDMWWKPLHWPPVYEEYEMIGILLGGLSLTMLHNIRSYWSSSKQATFQKMAFKSTSLMKVQEAARRKCSSNELRPPPKSKYVDIRSSTELETRMSYWSGVIKQRTTGKNDELSWTLSWKCEKPM